MPGESRYSPPINRILRPLALMAISGYCLSYAPEADASSVIMRAISLDHYAPSLSITSPLLPSASSARSLPIIRPA